MLALDLVEPIAERIEKVLVGRDDGPIKVEFDHGLRAAQCLKLSLCIDAGFTTEHFIAPKLMLRLQRMRFQTIAAFMVSLGISRGQLCVRCATRHMKEVYESNYRGICPTEDTMAGFCQSDSRTETSRASFRRRGGHRA